MSEKRGGEAIAPKAGLTLFRLPFSPREPGRIFEISSIQRVRGRHSSGKGSLRSWWPPWERL